MQKITLENRLLMIDTNTVSFDMQEIENRRFMYSPDSCELIIGEQYKGNDLIASHAEEHGKAGAKAPFDNFIRGWIGTGKGYKDGVIHFAPLSIRTILIALITDFPRWKCSPQTVQTAGQ